MDRVFEIAGIPSVIVPVHNRALAHWEHTPYEPLVNIDAHTDLTGAGAPLWEANESASDYADRVG